MRATVLWSEDTNKRMEMTDRERLISFVPVLKLDDGGAPCAVSDYHRAAKILNDWFERMQPPPTGS